MTEHGRADVARGLRQLADILEDERVPLPGEWSFAFGAYLPAVEAEGLTDDERTVALGGTPTPP